MRAAALATALLVAGGGCERAREVVAPPAQVVRARGAGVAAALAVHETAAGCTAAPAARPRSTCRAELDRDGAFAVTTTIRYRWKGGRIEQPEVREEHRWWRDAAGNEASERRIDLPLPDGRRVVRTLARRRVGDARYVAIDDRFSDAARIEGFDADLAGAAFGAVDAILSLVERAGDRWVAARPGGGLCEGEGSLGLPDPDGGGVAWSDGRRAGSFRWTDGDGTTLLLDFEEQVAAEVPTIEVPAALWPVEPEVGVAEIRAFVEAGRGAGWLEAGRVFGDAASTPGALTAP